MNSFKAKLSDHAPQVDFDPSMDSSDRSSKTLLSTPFVPSATDPDNIEGLDDHLLLSILDPSDNRFLIWVIRLFLFWCVFFLAGFYITFGSDPKYWAIGLGAISAYVICVGSYLLESYVIIPWYYRKSVGKPMVHWMSWGVFLDIIYHVANPKNMNDCRKEFREVPLLINESIKSGGLWLDFVADVGDGFNPTFAVFSSMARAVLKFEGGAELPRANAVIVGGDITYPWPRYEDIIARFIRPLDWAYPAEFADEVRHMYVMPGNHEWADGLRNFQRLILQRESIGAWTLCNKTPYFAIKLPHSWWMLCVDPGNEMNQDLDQAQIAYFTTLVRERTNAQSRFILCVHEPDWIKNNIHGFSLFKQLALFRHNVLGNRLRVCLAGDLHYYRRMEESEIGSTTTVDAPYPTYFTNRRQLVVAGHGGAFSHPTYVPDGMRPIRLGEPHVRDGHVYETRCNHPTPQRSRMTYNARWYTGFWFGKNHGFGSILGLIYVGMCLSVNPMTYSPNTVIFPTPADVWINTSYLVQMLTSFWFYPSLIFLLVTLMVIATTSSHLATRYDKAVNLGMGLAHLIYHVLLVLGSKKVVDATVAAIIGEAQITFANTVLFCFLSNSFMFLIGFFLAPLITAMHLYVSQNVVMNAYNEPMSTIEYQDDKGFLRMKIDRDQIDLYSIGIRAVPKAWELTPEANQCGEFPSKYRGANKCEIETFIVERVVIARGEDEVEEASVVVHQ